MALLLGILRETLRLMHSEVYIDVYVEDIDALMHMEKSSNCNSCSILNLEEQPAERIEELSRISCDGVYLFVLTESDINSVNSRFVDRNILDCTLSFVRVCQRSFKDRSATQLSEKCLQGNFNLFLVDISLSVEKKLRRDLCSAGRTLAEDKLVENTEGNLSVRIEETDSIFIKPTTLSYYDLKPHHYVKMNFKTGVCEDKQLKPSSEWHFHTKIYESFPSIGAVIHTHSPDAAACSCLRLDLPCFHYYTTLLGDGDILCTRYHLFGTEELAADVVRCLRNTNACLLANHGAVATGRTISEALKNARLLEKLCGWYLKCLSASACPSIVSGPHILSESERRAARVKLVGALTSVNSIQTNGSSELNSVNDDPPKKSAKRSSRGYEAEDASRERALDHPYSNKAKLKRS